MTGNAIGVLALQGDFAAHRKALARCGVDALEVRLPSVLEELRGLVIPGGESTTLLRLMREGGFDEAIPRFVDEGGSLFGTCAGAILLAREVSSPSQWSLGLIDIAIERNAYGRQIDSFETELTEVGPEIMHVDGAGPEETIARGRTEERRNPTASTSTTALAAATLARSGGSPGPSRVDAEPRLAAVEVPRADVEQQRPAVETSFATEDLRRAAMELHRAGVEPPLAAVFIRAPRIRSVGPSASVLASLAGEPVLVREGRVLVSTFHPEMTADSRVHRYFLECIRSASSVGADPGG